MLFSSLEFLLMFCPIVFGLYFLLPRRLKNYFLLLASLFFYAWGEPKFVLVMLASITVNYLLALGIEKRRANRRAAKALLAVDVLLNIGILFVFKYLNFTVSILRGLLPAAAARIPQTRIALPIGISFFTFQALSYVIDVYRGIPAQHNIGYLGLYISLFPQLIAGPIVRYTTVMDQIGERRVTLDAFSGGVLRFLVGFNKKVLLANTLAQAADIAFGRNGGSVGLAWLGALCYTLQIFFDFSGYSDMAIGLGRMLGFEFLENFDYPYISRTVTEFWRRWHISLGTWFRDYVYFPLGGSRVDSKRRLVLNLLAVWCLTGIWHGANWTFILWGLLYGAAIIFEKLLGIPSKLERAPAAARLGYRALTLLLVVLGWVLFRADDLAGALAYLRAMFGGAPLSDGRFVFYAREYVAYISAGVICALPVCRWLTGRCRSAALVETARTAFFVAQIALFAVSFSSLVMNAHNPFIYFNF